MKKKYFLLSAAALLLLPLVSCGGGSFKDCDTLSGYIHKFSNKVSQEEHAKVVAKLLAHQVNHEGASYELYGYMASEKVTVKNKDKNNESVKERTSQMFTYAALDAKNHVSRQESKEKLVETEKGGDNKSNEKSESSSHNNGGYQEVNDKVYRVDAVNEEYENLTREWDTFVNNLSPYRFFAPSLITGLLEPEYYIDGNTYTVDSTLATEQITIEDNKITKVIHNKKFSKLDTGITTESCEYAEVTFKDVNLKPFDTKGYTEIESL